jgi:hypothetical protein
LNQAIIELMKAQQTYPFRWNKLLYRNPPKARQQEEIIDPEELAKNGGHLHGCSPKAAPDGEMHLD